MKNNPTSIILNLPFAAAFTSLLSHSVCCGIPLLMIALGLGGLSLTPFLVQYHLVFTVIGVLALGFGFYSYWKSYHSDSCSCRSCNQTTKKCAFCMLLFATVVQIGMWTWFASASMAAGSTAVLSEEIAPDMAVFRVQDLHCPGCAVDLEHKVTNFDEVEEVDVVFSEGLMTINLKETIIDSEELRKKIAGLGIGKISHLPVESESVFK